MSEPSEAKVARQRSGLGWFFAGVSIWLAAPFLLIVALSLVAQQQSVFGADSPVWVQAEDAGHVSVRQVELALTWGESATVYAPSWGGTVRESLVNVGSTVKSGDSVVRVDGVLRVAWHSPSPLYRQLTQGDSGDDVAALNEFLASRSLPAAEGNLFTSATRKGTAALARDLGVGGNVSMFDPSWLLYLPGEELTVAEVHLTVGALAPAVGEPVLTGEPLLDSAVLVEAGSADQETPTPVAAQSDETLEVGGTAVELEGDRKIVSASLAALGAELASDQERVAAVLSRELPEGSIQIPAAAVHTAPDGATCILVAEERKSVIVSVAVVGGIAGQAVVTGEVKAGDKVGVGAIEAAAKCGS